MQLDFLHKKSVQECYKLLVMSLQPSPPSLPPEKSPEQSKSFRRQRWDYTVEKTEGQTVGLIAGVFGAAASAVVVGSVTGGIIAGVLAAFFTFFVAVVVIAAIYYLHSPRALDEIKENEITRLQSELEKLKGKNEQPDIECEIRDVHEESPSSNVGFDYIFTFNAYLKNNGRVVGIRDYKLRMIQNEYVYEAEKVSLKSFYLERQEPDRSNRGWGEIELKNVHYPLTDLEDMKNLPLDHVGREGWLRFVVREVWWDDEFQEGLNDDDDMSVEEINKKRIPKKLELTVIDSNGTEYKFEKSQPWTAEGRIRKYAGMR